MQAGTVLKKLVLDSHNEVVLTQMTALRTKGWLNDSATDSKTDTTASKTEPFVNSLGMKFVAVPGTKVLFCINDTRKGDYRKYAEAKGGVDDSWKNAVNEAVPVSEGEDHPVVYVKLGGGEGVLCLVVRERRPHLPVADGS